MSRPLLGLKFYQLHNLPVSRLEDVKPVSIKKLFDEKFVSHMAVNEQLRDYISHQMMVSKRKTETDRVWSSLLPEGQAWSGNSKVLG